MKVVLYEVNRNICVKQSPVRLRNENESWCEVDDYFQYNLHENVQPEVSSVKYIFSRIVPLQYQESIFFSDTSKFLQVLHIFKIIFWISSYFSA